MSLRFFPGLPDKLSDELDDARVTRKEGLRIIKVDAVGVHVSAQVNTGDVADIVGGSRNELWVVEQIEGLTLQFEMKALFGGKALDDGHVNVINWASRFGVAASCGESAKTCLDVFSVRIRRNICHRAASACAGAGAIHTSLPRGFNTA